MLECLPVIYVGELMTEDNSFILCIKFWRQILLVVVVVVVVVIFVVVVWQSDPTPLTVHVVCCTLRIGSNTSDVCQTLSTQGVLQAVPRPLIVTAMTVSQGVLKQKFFAGQMYSCPVMFQNEILVIVLVLEEKSWSWSLALKSLLTLLLLPANQQHQNNEGKFQT